MSMCVGIAFYCVFRLPTPIRYSFDFWRYRLTALGHSNSQAQAVVLFYSSGDGDLVGTGPPLMQCYTTATVNQCVSVANL